MRLLTTLGAAAAIFASAAPGFAQTAATPEWVGEGAFGAGITSGNTSTKDLAAGLKIKHTSGVWSESGALTSEYGETSSVETKNRSAASGQVDRLLNDRLSLFGRLSWENDRFSGFASRTFVGVGAAYKVIVSDPTQWSVQLAPGYKSDDVRSVRLSPTLVRLGQTDESFGAQLGSRFKHKFNDHVSLSNDTDVIYSDASTQFVNTLALSFDIIGNLSARLSYDVRYDTSPPTGFKSTDQATRVSLVYKIG